MDVLINIIILFIATPFGIPVILFLILALYWRQTGRFPVVGFLVRLLYIPINLLALVLWVVTSFLVGLSNALRRFQSFSGVLFFVLILLTLKDINFFFTIPAFLLLLRLQADTTNLREAITYYPRAKRRPEPKPAKAPRPVKAAAPKVPGKPAPAAAPPPIVQVAASVSGSPRKLGQLTSELPPHLQALIAGAEPEAEAAQRRKVPLVKLVLRSLLLLPFWLLLLPVKGFRAAFRKEKQPEPETEPQPLTSEASGNE